METSVHFVRTDAVPKQSSSWTRNARFHKIACELSAAKQKAAVLTF